VNVSILTPTLNAGRYVASCLRSIAAQSYPHDRIQHLVLDGGSTDDTVDLCRQRGAEVHVERDGSLYEALNRGMGLVRGDVIGWLNSDDTYDPDAIANVIRAFEAHPEAEIVVGHFRVEAAGRVRTMRTRADALRRLARGKARHSWIWPLAVFYRRETLRSLGPYPPGYRITADQIPWMRAAARTPLPEVVHTGTILGSFRVHDASLSAGSDPERSLLESIDIMERCLADPTWPPGVRRWALATLRRNTFWLTKWRSRNEPLPRRLAAMAGYHSAIRPVGPGALLDILEELGAVAGELARAAIGRPTPRW
jgi:glycosyltransferase involved in cell wall biosynthesis